MFMGLNAKINIVNCMAWKHVHRPVGKCTNCL